MKFPVAATILLSIAPSCAWNSKWTFAVTKECYDGVENLGSGTPSTGYSVSGGKEEAAQVAVFFIGLMVLPVAIDLACLPVAWVHDQVVCN